MLYSLESVVPFGVSLFAVLGGIPLLCLFSLAVATSALLWLDRRHRAAGVKVRRSWNFKTTPHNKTIRFPSTSLENWRLQCDDGRQRWFYEPGHRQTWFEQYQLGLVKAAPVQPRSTPKASLDAGIEFMTKLQDKDGHWANDYSGPLFLLPGAVFALFIVRKGNAEEMFTAEKRAEMLRYIKNTQNEDGGWGLHTEGHSIMFGTVLNYVAARMLGLSRSDPVAQEAQRWIEKEGGAQSIASWGKVWLAVLGLYDWEGLNPVPPEMWLLPSWFPISMGRVWCHSRIVTLPFGFLYGKRFVAEHTPLIDELRDELYSVTSYATMDWKQQQNNVHVNDIYTPHSGFYDFGNMFLRLYEKTVARTPFGQRLRRKALELSYRHIRYDDVSTNYINLGPVNKTLNLVINWLVVGSDASHPHVVDHLDRLDDYLWVGPEGMRMAGYNGSQLWDTSFAAQAMCATGRTEDPLIRESLRAAHRYVDVAQVREDPPEAKAYFRSPTKGCWNFSTRDQSWQVSDCTAEGLRVAVLLHQSSVLKEGEALCQTRMQDAVDVILALRSTAYGTGAWASYEEIRAPSYLELLNCAEVYKDIMIEYEYVECTSSCVQTLCMFRKDFPDYRGREIDVAVDAGIRFILDKQRPDGSWYGSWAVCFTYAAFFAVEALIHAEVPADAAVFAKNRQFLLQHQNADGGWGEDFNSCVTETYVQNPDGSQIVNTAWALMALMGPGWEGAGEEVDTAISRGVKLLMSRQLADGDWAQERISGVFNGNCAIHYASYKNNMPVWALAKYTAHTRAKAAV